MKITQDCKSISVSTVSHSKAKFESSEDLTVEEMHENVWEILEVNKSIGFIL